MAVRAGFARAWENKDYATIIPVVERLPDRVSQEDPEILIVGQTDSLTYDYTCRLNCQFDLRHFKMNKLAYKLSYSRHLPHIQPSGATLFITFRLVDSLTAEVQQRLINEAERAQHALSQITDEDERRRQAYNCQKRLFARWDEALDNTASGPRWLDQPKIAVLVADSLHYHHGRVYDLDTFCIMGNHVHVLFTPLAKSDGTYIALSAIMQSLKGYTASQANELLSRKDQFWQHESYDHIVRNAAELKRIRLYILNNPVKAGLVTSQEKWPWSYSKYHPTVGQTVSLPER
jgi:REP element-mobilizing transposase RayT